MPAKKELSRLAIDAAKYFGAECEANPGSNIAEYTYDMALRAGYEKWEELPMKHRATLTAAFAEGRTIERASR
jgi:hypothetical protein